MTVCASLFNITLSNTLTGRYNDHSHFSDAETQAFNSLVFSGSHRFHVVGSIFNLRSSESSFLMTTNYICSMLSFICYVLQKLGFIVWDSSIYFLILYLKF